MLANEPPITLREIEKKESRTGPSERELLLLVVISFAVMWATVFLLHRSTALVFFYGDNAAYRDVANAILHWNFRGLQLQHFMGYPYLIAAVSLLLHIPTGFALWLIALVCAAFSVWLTARLFGTVTAGYFAFTCCIDGVSRLFYWRSGSGLRSGYSMYGRWRAILATLCSRCTRIRPGTTEEAA